ncbi:MAG TPA: mechanosensitive ion channel [Novosphingobium sp.]
MNYIKTLHDQIDAMIRGLIQSMPSMVIALILLVITWFAARFAVSIAERLTRGAHMRENLKQLVETLVRLVIWLAGLMIAATIAIPGITPGSVFAGLGVGALAIGFAFQDIFQNFLAGVLIMLRDRMRIGDTVECDGIIGKVERITLRETHIRAGSNELTIVPNSVLFKNPVKITTDKPQRRFQIVVSVGSDHDLDVAADTIRKAVESVENIDDKHPVAVLAQEFKPGAVDFLVQWWAAAREKDAFTDQVIRRVKRALDDGDIFIAGAQPTSISLVDPQAPKPAPQNPQPARKQAEPA